MAMADLRGAVRYANPAAVALWGYESLSEIVGRDVLSFVTSPENAAAVLAETARSGAWRGELIARRRDGRTLTIETTTSLVVDERGHPVCLLGTFLDITERLAAQAAIAERVHRD